MVELHTVIPNMSCPTQEGLPTNGVELEEFDPFEEDILKTIMNLSMPRTVPVYIRIGSRFNKLEINTKKIEISFESFLVNADLLFFIAENYSNIKYC
jgi:hypothetical protein